MRSKVKAAAREVVALNRILQALEQELIEATDEEVIAAAKDLGMDPTMKGSGVFAGLKYPARPQLSDFFDLDAVQPLQGPVKRIESDDE
jgi:hypothetical protein